MFAYCLTSSRAQIPGERKNNRRSFFFGVLTSTLLLTYLSCNAFDSRLRPRRRALSESPLHFIWKSLLKITEDAVFRINKPSRGNPSPTSIHSFESLYPTTTTHNPGNSKGFNDTHHTARMASLIYHAVSLLARDRDAQLKLCTLSTCPIDSSYYFYRVSLAANTIFLTLFTLSLIGFVSVYALTRRGFAFTLAMFIGVAMEVVGYIGRILSWKDQWAESGFLIQIVCLTIAPAFMAAAIYLCIRRIVYAFGPENSRIKPESYTRIVRSLLLRWICEAC